MFYGQETSFINLEVEKLADAFQIRNVMEFLKANKKVVISKISF